MAAATMRRLALQARVWRRAKRFNGRCVVRSVNRSPAGLLRVRGRLERVACYRFPAGRCPAAPPGRRFVFAKKNFLAAFFLQLTKQ